MNVQTGTREYLREYETPTEAYMAAGEEANVTAGRVLSATLFRQGGRDNLALAMTMADLKALVRRDSASARGDLRSGGQPAPDPRSRKDHRELYTDQLRYRLHPPVGHVDSRQRPECVYVAVPLASTCCVGSRS